MEKTYNLCILWLSLAGCLLIGWPCESRAAGFAQDLTSMGITFHVVSVKEGGASRIRITLSGAGVDSRPVESRIEGTVTSAEVTDDLDNDGLPELYVYATCPEEGSSEAGGDMYSTPPVAAVVTAGPHAGHHGPAAVVVAPGTGAPSAVVVGPAVTARVDGSTVGLVPVVPVKPDEPRPCIHELKFIPVATPQGKVLKLEYSR